MSKGSRGEWQRKAAVQSDLSKKHGSYATVSRERLAALEYNNANAKSFDEVIRKGFRLGFTVGLVTAAVVSNLVWVAFRYLA